MPLSDTTPVELAYLEACEVALLDAPSDLGRSSCTEIIASFHPHGAQPLPEAWASVQVQDDVQSYNPTFFVVDNSGKTWQVKSRELPSRAEMLRGGWTTVGEAQNARALDGQQYSAYQACKAAAGRAEALRDVTSCRNLGIDTAGMTTRISLHPLTREGYQVTATTSQGEVLQTEIYPSFGYASFVGAVLFASCLTGWQQAQRQQAPDLQLERFGHIEGVASLALALLAVLVSQLLQGSLSAVFPVGLLWLCATFWIVSGVFWGLRSLKRRPVRLAQSLGVGLRALPKALAYVAASLLAWALLVTAWGWLMNTFFFWYK